MRKSSEECFAQDRTWLLTHEFRKAVFAWYKIKAVEITGWITGTPDAPPLVEDLF